MYGGPLTNCLLLPVPVPPLFTSRIRLLPPPRTDHCAAFAVGRLASTDGSTMTTHTDDMGFVTSDLRLVRSPAMDYPPGALRPVYKFINRYPRLVASDRSPLYYQVRGGGGAERLTTAADTMLPAQVGGKRIRARYSTGWMA